MPDIYQPHEAHLAHSPITRQIRLNQSFSKAKEAEQYVNESLEAGQELLATEVGEEESLTQTLEAMSLRFGSKLESQQIETRLKEARFNRINRALVPLSQTQNASGGFAHLVYQFQQVPTDKLLEEMQSEDLNTGAMLLVLNALSQKSADTPAKRRQYEALMQPLLQQKGWAVELCSFVELGAIPFKDLDKLKYVYQRAQDDLSQTPGLAQWFNQVKDWPDRRQRLHVLIRSLGLEFSLEIKDHVDIRMASTMADLQRLWTFLEIDDQAKRLEQKFNLPKDSILEEMILLLDQHWIDEGWITARVEYLGLTPRDSADLLKGIAEEIMILPDACFRDPTLREEILNNCATLLDKNSIM